jgi:small conductance mechanosensitive channel
VGRTGGLTVPLTATAQQWERTGERLRRSLSRGTRTIRLCPSLKPPASGARLCRNILFLASALFLWVAVGTPVAQVIPGMPATPQAEADPAATDAPTAEALQTLIRTIEDPEQRAQLLERLRTLRAAHDTGPEPAGSEKLAATVVEEVSEEIRRRTDTLYELAADILDSTDQIPALLEWLSQQVTDNERRTVWIVVITALVMILAVGLVARDFVLRLRPEPNIEQHYRSHAASFTVEILAALTFGGLTLGTLWASQSVATTYDLNLSTVTSAAWSLGLLLFAAMIWRAVVRLLFGERSDGRRLLVNVGDRTARLCREGLLRIGRLGFIGSGVLYAFYKLGLPEAVFLFLVHILYLAVAGVAIVLVLRLRETVANAIRAWSAEATGLLARFVPAGFLARTWHYLAIILILLHYLVWALKVPGGIIFLSRATLLSVAIFVVARLATLGVNKLFPKAAPVAETEEAPPEPEERVSRLAKPLRVVLRGLILVLAVLAVASVWNTGVVNWLQSDLGQELIGLAARLALIAGITAAAFEITSIVSGRFINDKDDQGKPVHSNRSRTLAGIAANVVYFLIGMIGLFTALSQIGVETAPLLAGAGVVGLAVGFGSQAMVKDLITGLFILLGDIMRIGDVVDIAGKAGVVEAMSMRTITLRSYDGSVHIIPYGSVDVVTNMTKEFSYALLDVGVAYRENTDEVVRVIREIDDRMRKEWPYRRLILEPIDIAGVDRLDNSAVVIRMRSKTRPGEQWGIRREFLRRIKPKFDELGIEIPFPHQTIYWGADKTGNAPPLRVEAISRDLREAEQPDEREQSPPVESKETVRSPAGPAARTAPSPPVAAQQRRAGSD